MHGEFLIILSRKREHVKTLCKDVKNALCFACRRWVLYIQTNYGHSAR